VCSGLPGDPHAFSNPKKQREESDEMAFLNEVLVSNYVKLCYAYGMVYSGAGFPMRDLYVVYCTSPVNF
jgi:hypothetical protein